MVAEILRAFEVINYVKISHSILYSFKMVAKTLRLVAAINSFKISLFGDIKSTMVAEILINTRVGCRILHFFAAVYKSSRNKNVK